MSEELKSYYERELTAIRVSAREFAQQYPGIATRLSFLPGQGQSADPHVERLIQAFALLAGRVHHKSDDDFPELTDALFSILYPHYLAPIPSTAVIQVLADPTRASMLQGSLIPRGTKLFTRSVDDVPVRFRTCYPVTLWPINITEAKFQPAPFPSEMNPPIGTAAVLRLKLSTVGTTFANISLNRLRLHLLGDAGVVSELYALLLNSVLHAEAVNPELDVSRPIGVELPKPVFHPVGFEDDEGVLSYPPQSFPGYRLLTEFFCCPSKFWFLDLDGFSTLRTHGFGATAELRIYLRKTLPTVQAAVDQSTFRLGCTPVVNLFEKTDIEPLSLTQRKFEYDVVPEVGHPLGYEIHSIDKVYSVDPSNNQETTYRPFYSVDHVSGRGDEAFWYAIRRPAVRANDRGTDVLLQFVDQSWQPNQPATSTLMITATCSNRDLPLRLQGDGDRLSMTLEMAGPFSAVHCVRPPTTPLRPSRRAAAYWRLLSHLSLNHLSIVDGGEGLQALREILRLYDISDRDSSQQQMNRQLIEEGLVGIKSRRVVGRVEDAAASGFARGIEVTVQIDDDKCSGTGAYLFASVLERFFGLYASINSFTQLLAQTRRGDAEIKRWPPRAGNRTLV